jgi:hypothetical protein
MVDDGAPDKVDGHESSQGRPGLSRRRFLILGAAAGGTVVWGAGILGTGVAGAFTGNPAQQLGTLRSLIVGAKLKASLRNRLLALVGDALDAVRDHNMVGACSALSELRALIVANGASIGYTRANGWISRVDQIRFELGCCGGPTGPTGPSGPTGPTGCSGPPAQG